MKGFSLIELLVSMAIGLVVSLAAASAYLGTRATASAQEELSRTNEYGKLALDMIGRELLMAGHYPASSPNDVNITTVKGVFDPAVKTGAAYAQGLFGCSGAVFQPASGTCGTADASKPDSVVINYFSSPELGTNFFNGFDCLRQDTRNDPVNTAREASGLPLLISNRFGIATTSIVQPTGNSISTGSVACNGNGQSSETNIYQPVFEGIEDMVIRYGVHDGVSSLTPLRFYTATEMNALGAAGGLTGWQRVASVRVCLLSRTLQNTRLRDTGTARTYRNCRGEDVAYNASEGSIFKTFERTFAIRNNITGSY